METEKMENPLCAKNAKHFYCSVSRKAGWVSPFGHRWIKASWQLPNDFRDHVRPSSEKKAKAFTVCVLYKLRSRAPLKLIRVAGRDLSFYYFIIQVVKVRLKSSSANYKISNFFRYSVLCTNFYF